MRVFLDTSAYVKIFSDELGTDNVKRLMNLAAQGKVEILISIWSINEAIAAVDKKNNQRKEISLIERDTIIATILQQSIDWANPSSNVSFIPIDKTIIMSSVELIHKLHISADDALQVYVAYMKQCAAFLCKDDDLKRKTDFKLENLRILDVTNPVEMDNLFHSIERQ